MHICFITNEFPKQGFPHGGIGSFVKTLAPALVKQGMKVSVVGINYIEKEETEIVEGVEIYRVKKNTVKGFTWYLNSKLINNKIKEIHQRNPIQIVESSELGLAFINKLPDVKYVIRLHGGHHFFAESEKRKIDKWKGFQEKRSFKKSDAFIAVSHYAKNHTEKYLSYTNKPLVYLNNPIDTDFFKPISKNESKNKIVFVGTVCEKKGIRQLIQAFSLVHKDFSNVSLEIYGRDWFFPDGSSYIQMLKEKELPQLGQLASLIHFHGAIPFKDIPNAYSKAAVCVFPSHIETQGLVAPEAMAMEKSVVFTKYSSGPETIEDYKTGLLCDPYDPEDIAEKIVWFLSNISKANEIGKKARAFVLRKYKVEDVVNRTISFFKELQN